MSKKAKKILCIVISIILLSVIPVYAMNASKMVEFNVPLLQNGDFNIPPKSNMTLNTGIGDVSVMQNDIYNQLLNCAVRINIDTKLYQFSVEEMRDIFCNVVNDHPDLFYVSSTVGIGSNYVNHYASVIEPRYIMAQSEIDSAKAIFNDGVIKAVSLIDDSMDDMQKALVMHDYVCDVAHYEEAGEASHSAYGFFKDGKVVCAGYSLAYSYLLEQVGVQCEFASSIPMKHAWNMTLINGNWYHTDLTYDDMDVYDGGKNIRGAMMHSHFLKSEEYFNSIQGGFHYGQIAFDADIASDKSLDNYFWNDVNTNIPVVDGNYYYLDLQPSNYIMLKRRDKLGNEAFVNQNAKFGTASMTVSNYPVDAQGVEHEVKIRDPLIRLTYLDDRFYIAYNKIICSMFTNGDYYDNITAISNYPVGLGTAGGNLVYQPYQTYTPVVVDKAQMMDNCFAGAQYNNYADVHYDNIINTKDYAKCQNSTYIF